MTLARRTKLLVGLSLLLAASLIGPAAAQASVLAATGHMPVALFGLDVGQLVGDIIKKLVDLVVPDFASHWAAALVKWLVAVPDVSNRTTYPHLNAVRSGLVGVGFALLGCSITASALQIMLGASRGAEAMKRAVVAGGVLVSYPKLFAIAVLAINITTGELITQPLVIHGIDDMLGAALVVAAITGGVSLGLALGAATACMYFVAALMVIKIGLTAIEAFLLLSGALVWGLYPLPGTSWLARMWTAGAVTVALIPITWALIFAAGALLSSDALLWSTSGKPGGLPTDLQQIVKPFAAVACFWVAYKAPVALLAACRIAGLSSSSVLPGAAGAAGGRSRNPLAGAVQTNRDRFRAIGMDARTRTAPLAASARQRAGALRASAVQSVGQRLAPLAASASTAAGAPSSARGRLFDDAITTAGATARGAAKAAEAAKTIATAPVRANRAWRKLPEQGAAARQRATQQGQRPSPPAADHTTAAAVPAAPAAVPGAPPPSAAVSGDGRGTATPAAAGPRTPEPSAPARGDRSASRRPHRPATPAASVAAPAAQAAAAPSPFPIRPSAPSSTPAAAGTTDAQRRTSSSSPSPRPAGAARPAAHAPAPERPAARPFHNTPATSTPSTSPAPDDRTPADRRPAA